MQLDVGKIYDGKVTGITKFGAFVELEPGTTGMVHISEVANTFVSEIKDHIAEGQAVKVKVLAVGEDGKISLSIKKAMAPPPPSPRKEFNNKRTFNNNSGNNINSNGNGGGGNYKRFDGNRSQPDKSAAPETAFEDMLNKFKQKSEERMCDLKKNVDNKRRSQSRRK